MIYIYIYIFDIYIYVYVPTPTAELVGYGSRWGYKGYWVSRVTGACAGPFWLKPLAPVILFSLVPACCLLHSGAERLKAAKGRKRAFAAAAQFSYQTRLNTNTVSGWLATFT